MKIDKVMNNNVVSSIDEDGQEIIVVGTGIGFQGKEGKVVDVLPDVSFQISQ